MSPLTRSTTTGWFEADQCDLDEFAALVETTVSLDDYPTARDTADGAVVYDSATIRERLAANEDPRPIMAELAEAMLTGPGIVIFENALDPAVIDSATPVFEAIIAEQRATGDAAGDHYAKPGANDRIWNGLQKLAVRAPDLFAQYYESDMIALAAEAWLGPGYQITSQINVVNPGGEAQNPHRDYHLGFLTDEQAERYPDHVHRLSPVLTLQGAIAHCDMPVESGPTMYLPHSQKYGPGYLAWRRADFRQYFLDHRVQLPLGKGDAVFFNPAVFHAAGSNQTTDVRRMANLLQVSSSFGRVMESMDHHRMVLAVYPELLRRRAEGATPAALNRVVAACADGYAFPTSLDHDQPIAGLAPDTQAEIVRQALADGKPVGELETALDAQATRRLA